MSIVLQRHVYELAAAFGIVPLEHDDTPSAAAATHVPITHDDRVVAHQKVAVFGRIVDKTSYAVALHELGHHAAPDGYLHDKGDGARRVALTIHEERAAWAWARHYALDWTEDMEAVAQLALASYTEHPHRQPEPTPPTAPKPAPVKMIDWSKY